MLFLMLFLLIIDFYCLSFTFDFTVALVMRVTNDEFSVCSVLQRLFFNSALRRI